MEAYVVHVKSWHPQALDSHSLSPFPMVVYIFECVMRNTSTSYHNQGQNFHSIMIREKAQEFTIVFSQQDVTVMSQQKHLKFRER